MRKVSFRPDNVSIGAFTRGPEMQRIVRQSGDAIAQRAGSDFEADTYISSEPGRYGQPRAISGVRSKRGGSNAADRLQQSIEAGRIG